MTDATLPAAVPLRLPPRSAYATPSSKSSKSTQRLKSSLTYYPIRPFAPLHVCMKDLTADIFHAPAPEPRAHFQMPVDTKLSGGKPVQIGRQFGIVQAIRLLPEQCHQCRRLNRLRSFQYPRQLSGQNDVFHQHPRNDERPRQSGSHPCARRQSEPFINSMS